MNRLERFYKIDQLLQEQTVVSRAAFLRRKPEQGKGKRES